MGWSVMLLLLFFASFPMCYGLVCDVLPFPGYAHLLYDKMGLAARKPVFGVSEKARFKPSQLQRLARKIEISLVGSLHTVLSKNR